MRFPIAPLAAAILRLAGLGSALSCSSCEALWGSLSRENPANCVASSVGCAVDETCDAQSQLCVSAVRLQSVEPAIAAGAGGSNMVVRGQRFVSGARVFVDDQAATDVVVRSAEEISFTLPKNTRGKWRVPVAVENPSGHRGESRDLFAYYADTLSFDGRGVSVGGQAIASTVGDWNGDHKIDIALLASPTSGVQILLGDGSGGFTSGSGIAIGSATMTTETIVALDGNRDGKPDLVVAAGGTVTVLWGDGQGGFPTRRTLYTAAGGRYISKLAVGDYDGDGRSDVAIADSLGNNLASSVYLLQGSAEDSFTTSAAIDSGRAPTILALADFTGDGNTDLLVGIQDVRLSLWQNDGGQARTQIDIPIPGCSARATAWGDLNRDGRTDLLLNCDSAIKPLLASGPGAFTASPDILPSTTLGLDIALVDLNGDGKLDGVIGRGDTAGDSQLVGLLGDGAGGFAAPQTLANYPQTLLKFGHALSVADFDGDGKTDLLSLSRNGSPTCLALLNRSS